MVKTLKDRVRQRLISEFGYLFSKEKIEEKELQEAISQIMEQMVLHEHVILSSADKKNIISALIDELAGFGPIESILKDPAVTEIMINGPKKIYVEKGGKKELSGITFDNEEQLMYVIYKILAPTRRRVDESFPYVDVSLKDGSRVNIIISPLVLNGPVVTVRKFSKGLNNIEDLINVGSLDKRMGDFLVACIKAKINIIFAGATGAGKTTTLGALSSYIDEDERIIIIEDTAELYLNQEHVIRLETRPPNIEGKGEVTIRDLFKNSLRMRPERIILGEIRGSEALDMLQAICSGHTGSLAVLHASSPQDVIYRLETMILTSGVPINLKAIHRQITAAINIIVQQEQLLDGSRKITYITQVDGIKEEQVILEDIFAYDLEGIDAEGKIRGRWKATGAIPKFFSSFKKSGIDLPIEIFNKD